LAGQRGGVPNNLGRRELNLMLKEVSANQNYETIHSPKELPNWNANSPDWKAEDRRSSQLHMKCGTSVRPWTGSRVRSSPRRGEEDLPAASVEHRRPRRYSTEWRGKRRAADF